MKFLGKTKLLLKKAKDRRRYIVLLVALYFFLLGGDCDHGGPGDGQPNPTGTIEIVSPTEDCKMVIDYSNYENPGIGIKARIDPANSNISINWSSADVGVPNQGSPVIGICNPAVSLTDPDGNAVTTFSPGVYNSTYYGGDNYLITASSAGYGLDISPTITLYKKMHIEVDWQTGLEPDLSWIDTKFGYTAPGLSTRTYILVETHLDETDLTPKSFHEFELRNYVQAHHQDSLTFTVYLGTIEYVIDHYTWTGISQRARGDTGWSFICVAAINDLIAAYPDSIGWVDTIRKEVTIHEIGHQIFRADHCDTSGCIMDPHMSFGERDTIFCANHLDSLRGIPKFWR